VGWLRVETHADRCRDGALRLSVLMHLCFATDGGACRPLQELLWRDCGVKLSLFPHQFDGVRYVAGVVKGWPKHYPVRPGCDNPLQPPEHATRGGILGDEMGLGKTIEVLCGQRVRDFLAGPEFSFTPSTPHIVAGCVAAVSLRFCSIGMW
jgi:hypothetical protein